MTKTIFILFIFFGTLFQVASSQLVKFTNTQEPCTCDFLTCTCCTGIKIVPVGLTKKICVLLDVDIFSLAVDVTIMLGTKKLTAFTFSASKPPTYCIPVFVPFKVSMCLKVHDVELVGLGLQICMTLYGAMESKNVIVVPFNCVKVTTDSMGYFTTKAPKAG